jgi:hypothetical protein
MFLNIKDITKQQLDLSGFDTVLSIDWLSEYEIPSVSMVCIPPLD